MFQSCTPRIRELEDYLDKGCGACHLQRPELADLVERALRFFHGTRYELLAWVVMPNDVHVLFTQKGEPLPWISHKGSRKDNFLKSGVFLTL